MNKLWSTTVYEPQEGGHRYQPPGESLPNSPCAICTGNPWDSVHALTERFLSDAVETHEGLYCVEASDDNERSYAANGLRWEDVEDAKRWAGGLALRWFGCTHIRVRSCDASGEPTGDTVHQTL